VCEHMDRMTCDHIIYFVLYRYLSWWSPCKHVCDGHTTTVTAITDQLSAMVLLQHRDESKMSDRLGGSHLFRYRFFEEVTIYFKCDFSTYLYFLSLLFLIDLYGFARRLKSITILNGAVNTQLRCSIISIY